MSERRNPWGWIPTLYFAEGLPYALAMSASVAMYKLLGISNTDSAFYTSLLYLPWVVKPLWSPVVDIFRRKRWWIVSMQWAMAGMLGAVALSLQTPDFFRYSLICLWALAFVSATHDIAADGFYMLALTEKQQSWFVGIRNTCYRLAMMSGQGLVVVLAGWLARSVWKGEMHLSWTAVFLLLAGMFLLLGLYHRRVLPVPADDRAVPGHRHPFRAFGVTFVSFFRKPGIGAALAFMLLFRLAESQLVKIASPFLLDARQAGGLGLSPEAYGLAYGTVGVIALVAGGILGGIVVSRQGLKRWIWGMAAAMNLPNAVYLYLSLVQPESLTLISSCVAVEQFGYGFGFTAYTLYLMLFSEGEHRTAHYALCTGFMALGMMVPGMFAGYVQEGLEKVLPALAPGAGEAAGYRWFFVWVMVCTLPGFAATAPTPPR